MDIPQCTRLQCGGNSTGVIYGLFSLTYEWGMAIEYCNDFYYIE